MVLGLSSLGELCLSVTCQRYVLQATVQRRTIMGGNKPLTIPLLPITLTGSLTHFNLFCLAIQLFRLCHCFLELAGVGLRHLIFPGPGLPFPES